MSQMYERINIELSNFPELSKFIDMGSLRNSHQLYSVELEKALNTEIRTDWDKVLKAIKELVSGEKQKYLKSQDPKNRYLYFDDD